MLSYIFGQSVLKSCWKWTSSCCICFLWKPGFLLYLTLGGVLFIVKFLSLLEQVRSFQGVKVALRTRASLLRLHQLVADPESSTWSSTPVPTALAGPVEFSL